MTFYKTMFRMLTVKLFQRAEKVQDSCLLQRISPVSFVYRSPKGKDQESAFPVFLIVHCSFVFPPARKKGISKI